MSQSRTRKPPAGEGAQPQGARPRPVAKASGDLKTQQPNQTHHHHRSKNRIPKSVRYDLENALVGLCDVWFEDIKPHLISNNIKVHIHSGEASAGAGDQGGRLPPGAPGCSHLDPGSTAARCELCRLLFNAANSIESAVSQAASATVQTAVTPALPAKTSKPTKPTMPNKPTESLPHL